MQKHVSLVAALQIGFSILGLLLAVFFFFLMFGISYIADDPDAYVVLNLVGTIIASFIAVLSIPALIGGIGLLRHKNWARVVILVVSAIDLLNFPIGTAVGAYSIWVLVHEDTSKLFQTQT